MMNPRDGGNETGMQIVDFGQFMPFGAENFSLPRDIQPGRVGVLTHHLPYGSKQNGGCVHPPYLA